MSSGELAEVVGSLSQKIKNLAGSGKNETWTRESLILKLLHALGWGEEDDMEPEEKRPDGDERLDWVLTGPPKIGVEAKALDVLTPRDVGHQQIVKGLRQSKERGARYFIWTNGDCWQFYSLGLEQAPIYQFHLSGERPEDVADKLKIIEKRSFAQDPQRLDRAIQAHWRGVALPTAWQAMVDDAPSGFIQLMKDRLPTELGHVENDILAFLRELRLPEGSGAAHSGRPARQTPSRIVGPPEWEELLHSEEEEFALARTQFSRRENKAFADYLVDPAKYREWKKGSTWRHAHLPEHQKKKAGTVVYLFKKWNFIETDDGKNYRRVEEGCETLKKLLEALGPSA